MCLWLKMGWQKDDTETYLNPSIEAYYEGDIFKKKCSCEWQTVNNEWIWFKSYDFKGSRGGIRNHFNHNHFWKFIIW